MKKRILIVITMLVLIAACILGIVKRQTYTDITREINYMNKLQVAEIPGDLAVEVCEDMKKNLQKIRKMLNKERLCYSLYKVSPYLYKKIRKVFNLMKK